MGSEQMSISGVVISRLDLEVSKSWKVNPGPSSYVRRRFYADSRSSVFYASETDDLITFVSQN
jgi:hypothetical protein